jgi:hypothetical protein
VKTCSELQLFCWIALQFACLQQQQLLTGLDDTIRCGVSDTSKRSTGCSHMQLHVPPHRLQPHAAACTTAHSRPQLEEAELCCSVLMSCRSYEQRGIVMDRLLLWEAAPVTPPSCIFAELPKELFHKYQYFNIPAGTDYNDASHPVSFPGVNVCFCLA